MITKGLVKRVSRSWEHLPPQKFLEYHLPKIDFKRFLKPREDPDDLIYFESRWADEGNDLLLMEISSIHREPEVIASVGYKSNLALSLSYNKPNSSGIKVGDKVYEVKEGYNLLIPRHFGFEDNLVSFGERGRKKVFNYAYNIFPEIRGAIDEKQN